MTEAIGGNAQEELNRAYERIDRLLDERDAINSDIKEIYAEYKGKGFDPKIMRKVVARMRRDRHEVTEEDALIETYEAGLLREMME